MAEKTTDATKAQARGSVKAAVLKDDAKVKDMVDFFSVRYQARALYQHISYIIKMGQEKKTSLRYKDKSNCCNRIPKKRVTR